MIEDLAALRIQLNRIHIDMIGEEDKNQRTALLKQAMELDNRMLEVIAALNAIYADAAKRGEYKKNGGS